VKFLVGGHLPHFVARVFLAHGLDAVHVDDIGLDDKDDTEIWREACRTGAIIVSKDPDFAAKLRGRPPHTRVLWLRCGNVPNGRLKTLMEAALIDVITRFEAGAVLVEALAPRR